MQISPEYLRENATRARDLAKVAMFLEGFSSPLARDLFRASLRWDHAADVVEARHAKKS